MADTPNNDFEKQLRDYAQQRRDAAGTPELHPATRAMLQAEVKQRLGNVGTPTARTERGGWARFWPRLTFALGVFVVLGIAAILIFPANKKVKDNFTLAKLEESKLATNSFDKPDALPVLAPAPAATLARREIAAKPAAPSAPTSISADTATANFERRTDTPARMEPAKAFKSGSPRDLAKTSAGSAAIPPGSAAQNAGQRFQFADNDRAKAAPTVTTRGAIAPGKAASSVIQADALVATASKDLKTVTLVGAGKKAEAGGQILAAAKLNDVTDNNNLGLAQRYRTVAAMEKQKQAASPVLDEFIVTQNGEALTVIDRDGSIYKGYARLAAAGRSGGGGGYGNSGALQLVPNSYNGGRGGALLNQNATSRSQDESRAQSQVLGGAQYNQAQVVPAQNAVVTVNYFFRVEGTNRSLNQRVIFTGNILQNNSFNNVAYNAQNSANTQAFNQQNAPSGSQAYFNNGSPAPGLNNFINGRVQLDDKKTSELNALSVGQ